MKAAALALLAALVFGFATPARAAIDIDPAALAAQMQKAYQKGAASGWKLADELEYFSTVLDAGRAYELRRRDDPQNLTLKGTALDLAVRLGYDPLMSNDAAEWYVRLAAQAYASDPQRGSAALALLRKLDAEDASPAVLAHDADSDATALVARYPGDVQGLIGQVDADLRAYTLTSDTAYRALAIARAAQPQFPVAVVPPDLGKVLWPMIDAARNAGPGYTPAEREAARAVASHKASAAKYVPQLIGRVMSKEAYLQITAPADEYFGHTKLSPIGVRNELTRIGKYLDAGWGGRMTQDTIWVVDSLDDWQHQYPRDYELPRLYKRAYETLARQDTAQAKAAMERVRRDLIVLYPTSTEARSFLAS